ELATTQNAQVSTPKQAAPSKQPRIITTSNQSTVQSDHTVKYGDTLWSIAKVYKVSVDQIIAWNKMTDKDKLTVGKT
ncbi:LysM peptidoglycan-binding domain-containing protein, partial [Psychrobacter sp. GW64-MNA-CIBAN-0177]